VQSVDKTLQTLTLRLQMQNGAVKFFALEMTEKPYDSGRTRTITPATKELVREVKPNVKATFSKPRVFTLRCV
jgi:hypothetical protein